MTLAECTSMTQMTTLLATFYCSQYQAQTNVVYHTGPHGTCTWLLDAQLLYRVLSLYSFTYKLPHRDQTMCTIMRPLSKYQCLLCLLMKGYLIQTGVQLPAHKPVTTFSIYLYTYYCYCYYGRGHCVEVRAQLSRVSSLLLQLDPGSVFTVWFGCNGCSCWVLSLAALPIYATCFRAQTGSPCPYCWEVSVISLHCSRRMKIGVEFLLCAKTTIHWRVTFIHKEVSQ